MKLGLLADIHGDVENLQKAIARLRQEHVDQFIVLGDVIYQSSHADATVELLRSCDAVGVWGNHELGLCVDPDDDLRELYSTNAMRFFGTLRPRLEIGDVLFSHTFPTEDASDILAYYVGEPEDDDWVGGCFRRFHHQIMLIGHFHRWLAATPAGKLDWRGERPLVLEPDQRYFVVMQAVMNGFAAVLDDTQNKLTPIEF
ncbi:metallophosphoesterase family protein [Rhodopirellula sp. JC639]|uniref:metallophosphoesterase family protein n=1 Tax=Stieleria mannarensis TaxID=2755585 RepID=UPI001601E51F|nr:metallophosphoesterase [Rhodopirellula sp. JC639]